MGKHSKRSFRPYSAWNYQQEVEELNKQSELGWQLVRGGCFSLKYRWAPELRYRYQLDYRRNVQDMGRYIETFREQGWEYVSSTFNGWHYFRKLYDPVLPEEQYEIFTDCSSLREMHGRWIRLAAILAVFCGILAAALLIWFCLMPMLPTLIQVLMMSAVCLMLVRGIRIMRKPARKKTVGGNGLCLVVFFLLLIGGCLSTCLLLAERPHFSSVFAGDQIAAIPAAADESLCWQSFEVKYPDSYYMDVEITAASPVRFTITDPEGRIVYTAQDSALEETRVHLHLGRGLYTVCFSDFAGGALNVSFAIK